MDGVVGVLRSYIPDRTHWAYTISGSPRSDYCSLTWVGDGKGFDTIPSPCTRLFRSNDRYKCVRWAYLNKRRIDSQPDDPTDLRLPDSTAATHEPEVIPLRISSLSTSKLVHNDAP